MKKTFLNILAETNEEETTFNDYNPQSKQKPIDYINKTITNSKQKIKNIFKDISDNVIQAAQETIKNAIKQKNLFVESIQQYYYNQQLTKLIIESKKAKYLFSEAKHEDVTDGKYILVIDDLRKYQYRRFK